MKIKIGKRYIGPDEDPFIIAEVGINHNGDFNLAKQLIYEAARVGADAVKFQKRTIDEMYIKETLDQPYNKHYAFGKTYGEHKRFLEFTNEQYFELQQYARECKIEFLVSGFDYTSFDFINNELNVPLHKIASPFITHFPLLKRVAQYGKPIIVSTGMHTMNEVEEAINYIKQYNDQIILFHAITLYPCPDEDVNLKVIAEYARRFKVLVGYSSHDKGVAIPAASVALGACVIEKHFTLDRTMIGPDHIPSVEPRGLELIAKYSKSIRRSLGSADKSILESEMPQRKKYGVSIVSKQKLQKGELITEDNITVKCPGGGISPVKYEDILGMKVSRDIPEDTIIYEEDIQ